MTWRSIFVRAVGGVIGVFLGGVLWLVVAGTTCWSGRCDGVNKTFIGLTLYAAWIGGAVLGGYVAGRLARPALQQRGLSARDSRHPDGWVIAAIWFVALILGVIAGILFGDGDTETDDEVGGMYVAFVLAGVATVIYVVIASLRNSRRRD